MVCPQDVEKDAVEASQDGLLEDMSKGGVWLERIPAMRRWKTSDLWTEKHLNVMRKMVVEGGRVWQRMYDTGWSDEKRWRGCNKKEGTEKRRLYHCPSWMEVRNQIPEGFRCGNKGPELRRRTGNGKEASHRML